MCFSENMQVHLKMLQSDLKHIVTTNGRFGGGCWPRGVRLFCFFQYSFFIIIFFNRVKCVALGRTEIEKIREQDVES